MLQEEYDILATTYDQDVTDMVRLGLFPYEGYDDLLDTIATMIDNQTRLETANILDLGIGTGNLYAKIKPEKFHLTGIDFSRKMLDITQLKHPESLLFIHDYMKGIPDSLRQEHYDFIISTYSIHHQDINELLDFIHYYLQFLNPFGKMILGDVLFLDPQSKQMAHKQYIDSWNENVHYHVYHQLVSKMTERLSLSFMKLSRVSGLIIIENYHECALQFEDNLVKYKSNTMKWKSNSSRKKSE